MNIRRKSPEEKVYYYMKKEGLNPEEKKDLYYQLTILDWPYMMDCYGKDFTDRIVDRISEELVYDIESISHIIQLYNNVYGVYTLEFARLITRSYIRDKISFMKGLNQVKDEAINIVYAFRLNNVFPDNNIEKDMEEIKNSPLLTKEEKERAYNFFHMYKTICST
ncbi:MAG: hypothetical protein GXY88_07750 [Tissierellia bacterium]|nr:hypothetical protein [Tissierellia bacterium]